jgi:hypothetical protein
VCLIWKSCGLTIRHALNPRAPCFCAHIQSSTVRSFRLGHPAPPHGRMPEQRRSNHSGADPGRRDNGLKPTPDNLARARLSAREGRRVRVLFGFIHDCCRCSEGRDRDHGARAAAFAQSLQGLYFRLNHDELDLFSEACAWHSDGGITDEPTIGACWGADRINFVRPGTTPSEVYVP